MLRELAQTLVNDGPLIYAKDMAQELGLSLDDGDFSLEIVMTLKQIQKAVINGNTASYKAVMDRLKGKPSQEAKIEEKPDRKRQVYKFGDNVIVFGDDE